MGLLSSSNKRTTINEDNRIINDYSGADFSQQLDESIDGNYNNNTGTLNVIDGGAFNVVKSANDNLAFLSDSAMANNAALAETSLEFGNSVFNTAASSLDTVAQLADNVNERGLDAALAVHDAGLSQLQIGSELALALNEQSAETQQDNNNALNNGFKSMMQFAENFSRSDGAAVANTNMKTIGVIVLGLVAAAFIFKRGK